MRLYADVYDAAGQKIGPGPITTLTGASVQRVLDGIDTLSLTVPGDDVRALKLLTHGRRVRLYVWREGAPVRELGRMVIVRDTWQRDPSQATMTLDGPGEMVELRWTQTWPKYVYGAGAGATLQSVMDALLSLTDGWSAEIDPGVAGKLIAGRTEGASVFASMTRICQTYGLHFRQKPGAKVVQIGAFGDASGVVITETGGLPAEHYRAESPVIPFTAMSKTGESERIVNEVVPLGAGDDEAALTLQGTTRATANGDPYDPVTITRTTDGAAFAGLRDATYALVYGWRQALVKFDITPIDNTPSAVTLAKNALYDAAAVYLRRNQQKQESFALTLPDRVAVVPGQMVRLIVQREVAVRTPGNGQVRFAPVDVNGLFWVMDTSEDVGGDSANMSLTLSSVDQLPQDAAGVLVDAIDDLRMEMVVVKQTLNHYIYGPESRAMDASNSVNIKLPVGAYTQQFIAVRLYVTTQPFTATSQAGPHRHTMFVRVDQTPPYTVVSSTSGNTFFCSASGSNIIGNPTSTAQIVLTEVFSASNELYTYGAEAETVYAIQRDTERPAGLTVTVNGVQIVTGVGTTGADFAGDYDITEALNNRPGGMVGLHDIDVTCTSGQGEVVVALDIVELIVPVA